tara:strand:- start:26 stop:469 length:444 start_codon:yes stop_codon:yes gene_type:complete
MTWEDIVRKAKDYETGSPLVEGPRTKEEQEEADLYFRGSKEEQDKYLKEQSKKRARIDEGIYVNASVLIQSFKPVSKYLKEESKNNSDIQVFLKRFKNLIEQVLLRIENSISQETDFVEDWTQLTTARTNQYYRKLRDDYREIKDDL